VTKERAKPEKPNTFNASTAFNNLNLKPKRNALIKKAKNVITNPFGRIGKWNPAITNAKTMNELNTIEKNLNARVKLRNNIKRSTLTPKEQREYTTMVMKLNKNVKNTRNLFERGVNKKVSNVTGPLMKGILNKVVANNKGSFNGGLRLGNNNKPNMKLTPHLRKLLTRIRNHLFLLSTHSRNYLKLRKLRSRVSLILRSRIKNLNKMKEIRNKAVMENREISEKEKRNKEEAKRVVILEPKPLIHPSPISLHLEVSFKKIRKSES